MEKFWSSFFKSLRGGGREALLALRRGRNNLGVFFLITFSFAPMVSKEKVAKEIRLFKDGRTQFAPTVSAPTVSKRKAAKETESF